MSFSGYNEIKESSIQIHPSVRLLRKYKQDIKLCEGRNHTNYGTIRDRLVMLAEILVASLMVDEIEK